MGSFIVIALGLAIGWFVGGAIFTKSGRTADVASSVMLQAMERGYQCHAAGRDLADCQQEQRARWANPTNLPPFGASK